METTTTIASESITQSFGKSWEATKANIWLLAGFCVVYGIAYFGLGLVPFVSTFVSLCSFIFTASLFAAFQNFSQNGKLDFNEFFSWSPRFGRLLLGNLLLIGLFLLIFIPLLIIIVLVLGVSYFTTVLPEIAKNVNDINAMTPESLLAILGPIMMFIGIMFLLGIIASIFLFAYPFLVQYTEMPLMDALRRSFKIGRNNAGQILLYFIISFGLMILGFLALGIGIVVTLPLIVGAQYYFLRSIILPVENIKEENKWDFLANENTTETL